ncbi:MAG: hypothetical protein ACYC6C_12460, partial [Coriobacteriia bacterium]
INFNNEEALNVKNARLSGTQLLRAPEVIDRIYLGDRITHFVINIVRLTVTQAIDFASDVTVDFRNGLKIQFVKSDYEPGIFEGVALQLDQIIRGVLSDEAAAMAAESEILTRLIDVPIRNQNSIAAFLKNVKSQLKDLLPTSHESIDRYFGETFRL